MISLPVLAIRDKYRYCFLYPFVGRRLAISMATCLLCIMTGVRGGELVIRFYKVNKNAKPQSSKIARFRDCGYKKIERITGVEPAS